MIQNTIYMANLKKQLNGILSETIALGDRIQREGAVYRMELEERQRLGLTGDAAVKHYNDYMDKHGMSYLKVN